MDTLVLLKKEHGFHPDLPKRILAFVRKIRGPQEKYDPEIERRALQAYEQVFGSAENLVKQAEQSAMVLSDLYCAGFHEPAHAHGKKHARPAVSMRFGGHAHRDHADHEEADAHKLHEEHIGKLHAAADGLHKLQQEVAAGGAHCEPRLAELEVEYGGNLARYPDLRKDTQACASQKSPSPQIARVLEIFAILFASVDPIVDTVDTGMPRDLSWMGLRKMISDPDRFIATLKALGKKPKYMSILPRNHARARELHSQDLPSGAKTTLVDVKLLWAVIGTILDMVDIATEHRTIKYVTQHLGDVHADVKQDAT